MNWRNVMHRWVIRLSILLLLALQSCAKKERYSIDGTLTLGLIANAYDPTSLRILKRRVEGVHCVDAKPERRRSRPPEFRTAVAQALAQAPGSNVLVDASLFSGPLGERQVCWRAVGDAGILR